MPRLPRLWVFLLFVGAFAYLAGLAPPVVAQKKKMDDSPGRLPADGSTKLATEYGARGKEFRDLAKGEKVPTKADAELIDLAAKYHVYRLTWSELTQKAGSAQLLINQLENVYNDALRTQNRSKTNEFLLLFSRQTLLRAKELLSHDDQTIRVNAALLLPLIAKAGNPETADLLVEVLQDDKQSEAVRYWTLPALHELFSLARNPPPVGVPPVRFKEGQEERCIVALLNYLQRPPNFPDRIVRLQQALADEKKRGAVSEEEKKEVAQYEAGMQFARRAAIRALAETRYPALTKKVENKVVADEKALTALALLRVVGDDVRTLSPEAQKKAKGVPPLASLSERVEAAIGVAQLRSELLPDYNPDYAAFHVGNFLVEFGTRSNAERIDKENRREPWRQHAGKLLVALGEWKEELRKRGGNDPGLQYAQNMIERASKVLTAVEAGSEAAPADLGAWLGGTQLPTKSVYKGLSKAVVKPPDSNVQ